MYDSIKIDHKTFHDCLDLGTLYIGNFLLSLESLETKGTNLLTLDEI